MLFVNSSEIWYDEQGTGSADDALVLSEIDYEQGVPVLSDPGQPEGYFTVPIEVLEDAWADGDNSMLIAEEPAPETTGEGTPAPSSGEQLTEDVALAKASTASTTATADSAQIEGLGLQGRIPETMHWIAQRPWVLLPIAIGAARLTAR